jgi:hypothetical protein
VVTAVGGVRRLPESDQAAMRLPDYLRRVVGMDLGHRKRTVDISSRFRHVLAEESVDIGLGEDVLSKDCPHVAVVKAGRRPPAGHGLDDGAARTAAAPQWTRTPVRGS